MDGLMPKKAPELFYMPLQAASVRDWRMINLLQVSAWLPAQEQQQPPGPHPDSISPLAAVSPCMPLAASADLLDHFSTLCVDQQNSEAEVLPQVPVGNYVPLLSRYHDLPKHKPWGPTGSAAPGSEAAAAVRATLDSLAAKLRVKQMQQMYAALGR